MATERIVFDQKGAVLIDFDCCWHCLNYNHLVESNFDLMSVPVKVGALAATGHCS